MKNRRVLGIVELGGEYVKIARVETRGGKPFLAGLRLGRIGADGDQAAFIKTALQELRLLGVPVMGMLPRQVVNLRLMDLPSVNKAEVADMVDLQIGKQTPYSRDEIVSGYKVLAGAREGYSRVMLAIVQKVTLRQRIQPLEQAGAEIGSVSISTDGLIGWCGASSGESMSSETVAVLDVDFSTSEFLVLSDGQPLFTRSIPMGAGSAGDAAAVEQLAQELDRSVEACHGEMPGRSLSRIVLTGAAGKVGGLAEAIAARLSVPCETRNALLAVKADSRIKPDDPVSLAAVVGMAAQGGRTTFDLLPDTILAKRLLLAKARNLTAFAVFAAVAMVSLSVYGIMRYMLPLSALSAARADLAAMERSVRGVERMQEIISLVRARQGTRTAPVRLLNAVVNALPADTRICGLEIDYPAGRMTIQADCGNTKGIRDFEDKLRESGVLLSAKERNTRRDPATQRWVFEIGAELEATR